MIKKFIKSDNGVVGIVVAVLLIGLIVAVVSLIQAVYVPKWMEEMEAEHMDLVVTQFTQLKSAIDTHVANEQILTPIASPITLGNKELPYLMSLRAYGSLEILSKKYSITVNNNSDNQLNESFGIIKYSSMNGYFIDQSFIYENGAFITNQREGNMLSMKPSMFINNTNGEVIITFNLVNITPVGGKTNGGGYGTTSILTEYNNTLPDRKNYSEIHNVSNIIISTSYPNAWKLFLEWTLNEHNVDVNKDDSGIVDKGVKITFKYPDKITLQYKIVEIYAQIGPGWVE
jgi:hypothetical protein